MSYRPINRSPDLKRLRDEGYDLAIRSGFLLVKDIPYQNPAQESDPAVSAQTFPAIAAEPEDDETVFNYIDTASSRAEIDLVTKRLAVRKLAIVGLGGTGSYVLDLIAKTPAKEIHLFEGDV